MLVITMKTSLLPIMKIMPIIMNIVIMRSFMLLATKKLLITILIPGITLIAILLRL